MDYPPRDFPVPDGIEFVKMCPVTGKLAGASCPTAIRQAFLRGSEPAETCAVDHAKPVALAPSFQRDADMPGLQLGTTSQTLMPPTTGPAEPEPLPTDEELKRDAPPEDGHIQVIQ